MFIVAGLSNLTTGFRDSRRREMLEKIYIPMLAAVGLTMILMNTMHTQSVQTVHVSRMLLSEGIVSWEGI